MSRSVCVLVPVLNEENTIEDVLQSITNTMKSSSYDFQILAVDDGSTDGTAEVLARFPDIKVIRNVQNKGYGFSIRRGIDASDQDYIVTIDGDGTYPANEITGLLKELDEGFDLVVGARTGKAYRGNMLKSPARQLFKLLADYVTGKRIPDINSGLRAFRRKKITPHLINMPAGFSFSTSMTLSMILNHDFVKHVPIPYYERRGSKSKVRHFRDTLRTLQLLTSVIVRYNPLKLFLLLAIPLYTLSALFLVLWLSSSAAVWIFSATVVFSSAMLVMAIGFLSEIWRAKA